MTFNNHLLLLLTIAPSLALAQNQEADSKLKISGHVSIVAGAVFGGSMDANRGPAKILGIDCPCYQADYSTAAVYGSAFTAGQESSAGIQAQYELTESLSLFGSLDAHTSNSSLDLSSAYVKYSPNQSLDLRIGRQRIPIYYYSTLQSVGLIYPFITPPPELYGWDATYYNGASFRFSKNIGKLALSATVFGGSEHIAESSYFKFSYDTPTSVDWTGIAGAEIEAVRGAWSARAFAFRTNVALTNAVEGIFGSQSTFSASGIGLGYDSSTWIANAEATVNHRNSPTEAPSSAYTIGIGRHFERWTPYASYSSYRERMSDFIDYDPTANSRTSFTLRYNLDSNTAIKAQFDRNRDDMNNYGGHANVFRISYDKMFF